MTFVAAHPDSAMPDFTVKSVVDAEKPEVQVTIGGFVTKDSAASPQSPSEPLQIRLTPAFAWDSAGYAPLVRQLLNSAGESPARAGTTEAADNGAANVLDNLLHLTGKSLALEDVRISANLEKHPASWRDHEAAALLLTALALREHAGVYSDNRTLLNRATAHLALAEALRGNEPATWPGLIAESAIATFAGREVEALSLLDNLSARSDGPASAASWIAALRLLAKGDWRVAEVKPESPLLLKIAWFTNLSQDLPADLSVDHLRRALPSPSVDPSLPDDQQKGNPDTLIPDWSRIAAERTWRADQMDPEEVTRSVSYKLDMEFHELDDILPAEGAAALDLKNLAPLLSQSEKDTISRDTSGRPVVHVIGLETFEAASRRHLLSDLGHNHKRGSVQDGDDDSMDQGRVDELFGGVPGYDFGHGWDNSAHRAAPDFTLD
jgi:hypothetical protein